MDIAVFRDVEYRGFSAGAARLWRHKVPLVVGFLTAGHATPAVLFLCPVSTVGGVSCAPKPRPLPDGLVGGVAMLGGKPGGEKGNLAAVSCATSHLFVSTRSALVLVSAAMLAAWLSMVAAFATVALDRALKDLDIFLPSRPAPYAPWLL